MLWVAAPCCSTAEEIDVVISLMRSIVCPIALIALTELFGGALHVDDMRADLVGGLCGLAGQGLDLLGHHREAAAGFAGARGLDGRIERQQIGLFGDRCDQLHDVADPVAGRRQFRHPLVGRGGLLDRLGRYTVRTPEPGG